MSWTNSKSSIFFILLWSFLVHLPGLFSPLRDYHAYRQCQTASMATNYVRHGMQFMNPQVDTEGPPVRAGTEFPVYSYLLAGLYQAFGMDDMLGRLLSMAFAAWGAIFLFLFIRPRFGETIARSSALVMCSIPIHIFFTRTVQPEPMALWGLLGFLYYGDIWLSNKGTFRHWLFALCLGSIAPLLKLPYLYLLFPLWFFLAYDREKWRTVLRLAWLGLLVGFIVLPLSWYHYAKSAPVVLLPLGFEEHVKNLAPIFTLRLWRAQFVSRIPELVLTYSGILLSIIGLYNLRKAKSFYFLLGWSFASVVYVGLLGEYGLIHFYTLLPLSPIAAVWIASGISYVSGLSANRPLLRLILYILVLGIPLHAGLRIKHWYRVEYDYVLRAEKTLATASEPDDLILVAIHEKPVPLHYFKRYGYAVEPRTWTPQEVDQLVQKGVRFIFIPKHDNAARLSEWTSYAQTRGTILEDDPEYVIYRMVGSMSRLRQG